MEMPNGRIYTYHSHPGTPAPTKQEIVRTTQDNGSELILTVTGESFAACSP